MRDRDSTPEHSAESLCRIFNYPHNRAQGQQLKYILMCVFDGRREALSPRAMERHHGCTLKTRGPLALTMEKRGRG